MGWPEIPNGDREICRLISRRTGLISGWQGDKSTIFSDSCLIFRTWLWIRTPFWIRISSLLFFMFSMLQLNKTKELQFLSSDKVPSYPLILFYLSRDKNHYFMYICVLCIYIHMGNFRLKRKGEENREVWWKRFIFLDSFEDDQIGPYRWHMRLNNVFDPPTWPC